MVSIKKILVTGSSGTIGTRLCEKLLEAGYEVVGVDWNENKWNKEVQEKTIIGDLRDRETLKLLPNDVDLVIHLAANARVYNLVVEPSMARDNFETLFNVLEFTRTNNIKRFMFASSREVYGNSNKAIHSEEEVDVQKCESPYTASKMGGEALVRAYEQCYDMEVIIFRFSNVYGMYDESDRIVPLFIKQAKEGKDLTVFGKDKLLDFTYIDDTIGGILLSIEKFDYIKNDVYNLAYGEGTSLIEVAERIKEFLNPNLNILVKENRTGEVVQYIADITKAKKKIGYQPTTTIVEGLQKSIKWYEENA